MSDDDENPISQALKNAEPVFEKINEIEKRGVDYAKRYGDEAQREVQRMAAAAKIATLFDKLRQSEHSQQSVRGGKKSGEVRKEQRPWVPHARELAIEIWNEKKRSQDKVVEEIQQRWKLERVTYPSHPTLKRFISELQKAGVLRS